MSDLIRRVFERKIVQWALAYGAGAWLVLEVVHTLAEIWLWPPLVAQAVTVVLAVGFIGALILAWYHGEQGRQYVGGTELLMLGGLLVIAAIAVSHVARKSTLEETATTALPITVPDDVDVRSIAVLPFASFSAESGQDWFAAGMHEALLTALQQIGALRVTSRTSALRYRETGLLLPEVARELAVRWLLSQMGRHEEAIRTLERAVSLDPRSALMHGDLGWWLYGGGHYERAIEEASVAIQLDPDYPEGYWLLAATYAQQGRHTEALQAFARYEAMYGEPVYWFRGYLLGLAGRREAAPAALTELEKLVQRGKAPTVQLAQIHLGLAEYEAVLDVLERSSEASVSFQPYLWPEYRVLFADARFRALLEKFRLPLPSQP